MKSIIRSIVFAGLIMGSTGAAMATVGGTAPTPRPPQQNVVATFLQVALSLIGL